MIWNYNVYTYALYTGILMQNGYRVMLYSTEMHKERNCIKVEA